MLQEEKLVFGTLLKQNSKQRTANIGFCASGVSQTNISKLQIQTVVRADKQHSALVFNFNNIFPISRGYGGKEYTQKFVEENFQTKIEVDDLADRHQKKHKRSDV